MYHNLATLYETTKLHEPDRVRGFTDLKNYCLDADNIFHQVDLPHGYNSLKWLIYKLRDQLSQRELEGVFKSLLLEASVLGESYLYFRIKDLPIYGHVESMIHHSHIPWNEFPIRQIGDWRILVNESMHNLTSLAFKQNRCDIIIYRNSELHAAGIVFRVKNTEVMNDFNVESLFAEIQEFHPSERWVLLNGIIFCGGHKSPNNQTEVSVTELLVLLKKHHRQTFELELDGETHHVPY